MRTVCVAGRGAHACCECARRSSTARAVDALALWRRERFLLAMRSTSRSSSPGGVFLRRYAVRLQYLTTQVLRPYRLGSCLLEGRVGWRASHRHSHYTPVPTNRQEPQPATQDPGLRTPVSHSNGCRIRTTRSLARGAHCQTRRGIVLFNV